MKSRHHHHRSQSGESDSLWVSTLSEDTPEHSGVTHETSDSSASHVPNHLLTEIGGLEDDGSGVGGASFLHEDHSLNTWSDQASRVHRPQDEQETNIMSPASVAGIVDEVLTALQRAREERNASRISCEQAEEQHGNQVVAYGIGQLKHTLKTYNQTGLRTTDVALLRRVEDFHRARFLRRQERPFQPWGIYGLFRYLSDLQLDLEWAEDAAWRRANGKVYLSWSDFQAIHERTRQPLFFVYSMIFISTLLLLVSFHMNQWKFAPIRVNPMLGPSPEVLFRLGALERSSVLEDDEWYRLLAPMFLHAGLVHFGLNILALIFIGGSVERRHGTPETILIFLLTVVGGNMASTLFMSPSISVGASGGIFGLLGVCLADVLINWDLLTLKNHRDVLDPAHKGFPYGSVVFWLTIELVINILVGLTPYVDQFAHIAGLLLGIGFGIPFLRWLKGPGFFGNQSAFRHCMCGLARFFLFAITLGAFFTMAFFLLNSDGGTLCESCRYISCVPFPFWKEDTWWHCDDCDLAVGKIEHLTPSTIVELTCPDSQIIQVDLLEANVNEVVIQENLSNYCRQSCTI